MVALLLLLRLINYLYVAYNAGLLSAEHSSFASITKSKIEIGRKFPHIRSQVPLLGHSSSFSIRFSPRFSVLSLRAPSPLLLPSGKWRAFLSTALTQLLPSFH